MHHPGSSVMPHDESAFATEDSAGEILDIDTSTKPSSLELPVTSSAPARNGQAKQSTADARQKEEDHKKFVDEFGFELSDDSDVAAEMQYVRGIDGKQVLRREVKWAQMSANWHTTMSKNFDKIKDRSRKGIPSNMRGACWQLLSKSRVQMESPDNAGVYKMLLTKPLESEIAGVIERDLGRTFPTHSLFHESEGVGQRQLHNILHVYCNIDPEVGYVQGMGFIVGTLLTQMGEEEAFWCLHAMMNNETYNLREMFRPGLPMLQMFFFQLERLIESQLPKLSKHLVAQNAVTQLFSAQWFLTLFVYHFQFRAVLRVWDVFFTEGWKIVFRVAIALLKWEEKELLALPFDQLLPRIKTMHEGKSCDEILTRTMKVKFKTDELLKYRREYEAQL